MPRSRYRDDDSAEFDPPPRRGGFPAWLLVLLIVGGGFVLCGGVGVVAVVMSRVTGQTEPTKRTYTREEFRTLVMGKTEAEVIAAVGRPESTSDIGDGRPHWVYQGVTRDTVSGKIDGMIFLHFEGGKVESVGF
jgi:hypothetical protein